MSIHNTIDASIVKDGLISYWTFEKNTIIGRKLKDIWGVNDAKFEGNPKLVSGYFGDALEFDGVDDYVNLTNLGNFGEQVGTSTFEAWVKLGNKNGEMSLYSVEDECVKWSIKFLSGNNKERDRIKQLIGTIMDLGEDIPRDGCRGFGSTRFTPRVSDGKWHHVVYTRDIFERELAGGKVRQSFQALIYIDTNLISIPAWRILHLPKYIPFVNPVYLGAAKINGIVAQFFEGVIDEVRIYNRPLSEEELIQNYESDVGLGVELVDKLPIVWGELKTRM